MNLKFTLVFTLLLAIAAIPAIADDQMAIETARDVSIHLDGTASTPTPVRQELAHPPEFDELSLELTGVRFIEASATTASFTLTCEEIDGTPCSSSGECGSCYPTPSCPLTPCFCGYGVCQCDIEAGGE